jgi:hypothetical protein
MRRLSLVLVAAVAAGCASSNRDVNEERPAAAPEARWWELQGNHELARAHREESLAQKEIHFNNAIFDFRAALDLYSDELARIEDQGSTDLEKFRPYPGIRYAARGPVPAGRREALQIEIDRISINLERLVRERPIDLPPPVTISEKLVPLMDRSDRTSR